MTCVFGMPPEVYLEHSLAVREARRWVSIVSQRRKTTEITGNRSVQLRGHAALHIAEKEFPEPWRACPLWVGVRWSSRDKARLRTESLALDPEEAATWVQVRSRFGPNQSPDPELSLEAIWERGGVRNYVAIHRLKRFIGF